MAINIKIENKHIFLISAIFVFCLGVSLVFSYTVQSGTTPNPGHALTSIQGYFLGDSDLKASFSKFCQTDGTNCPDSTPSTSNYGMNCYEAHDSGTPSANIKAVAIDLPEECYFGGACLFNLQSVVNNKQTSSAMFYQSLSDNRIYTTDPNILATNGDSIVTHLLSAGYGGSATTSRIYDDYLGVETDARKITVYTYPNHRTKLIICYWNPINHPTGSA